MGEGAGSAGGSAPSRVEAETPDQVARRYGLAGELLVAKGDRVLLDRGYGTIAPSGGAKHRPGARWRLASITKQVVATLAMQDVDARRIALDTPVGFAGAQPFTVTPRALLTHHSGLPNPDATPAIGDGFPSFYLKPSPDLTYCTARPAVAGSPFNYNNCDYLLVGQLLERGGGRPLSRRWPAGMTLARPGQRGLPGYIGGKPEPVFQLASFGAAGALTGTARDLFRFDRQLMTGTLLSPAARAELWKPEGGRSYQALGQWVFPGTLKGCAAPKRIVQRDGEIGGVQTRNFIFPDDDLVIVVFTNRGPDDFAIGEVWQGKGFAYDLLSAAACP